MCCTLLGRMQGGAGGEYRVSGSVQVSTTRVQIAICSESTEMVTKLNTATVVRNHEGVLYYPLGRALLLATHSHSFVCVSVSILCRFDAC